MTEYRFTFELSNRRGKGESPGLSVFDPTGRRSGSITTAAGNHTILAPTIAEYCFEKIQRAECIITAGADVALINTRFTTWRGLNGWFVETPGVPPVINFYTNAVGDPTILEQPVFGDRKDVLQITGAAAAALGDLTGPGNIAFHVEVSKTDYFSSPSYAAQSSTMLFDDYLDDMEFPLPNLAPVALKRLKTIQNQGGGLVVLAETINQKISVPSCCAALPFGPPIIVAADVGNGFGQIPALAANWSAANFKPHPRVFIRPSNNTGWAIQHLGPSPIGNPTPLTSDVAVYPLLASRAPTHSAWRIGLDGCVKDVIIAHPANSDFRRPRDIWKNVWAPAIATDKAINTWAYYFVGLAPNFVRNWFSRGVVAGLEYLDFAYCLDLFDSDGGTPLVQFPEV